MKDQEYSARENPSILSIITNNEKMIHPLGYKAETGARIVDKKHVRMICTVGTSLNYRREDGKNLLQDDKDNEKLLQESEQGRDSPLYKLMRTGAKIGRAHV